MKRKTIQKKRDEYCYLLYWYYVEKIKSKGILIFHKNIKGCYGKFCHKPNQIKKIFILKKIAGTLTGLIVLLHEYRHYLHLTQKKYKSFYLIKNFDEKKHKNLIFSAEWNCYKYSKDTLKRWGINTYHVYLDKKWVKENLLPAWIEHYCH